MSRAFSPSFACCYGLARVARVCSEEQPEEGTLRESDPDEDDPDDSMSLAAIEAGLKPKVLETFDAIADTFKRLRRLQDRDIHNCTGASCRAASAFMMLSQMPARRQRTNRL